MLLFWALIWWAIMRFSGLEISYSLFKNQVSQKSGNIYKYFENVDNILKVWYYDYEKIDKEKMVEEALKAYVDSIWDPYTVYMNSDQNSWFLNSLEWEEDFEWIWAIVTKKEYYIQIEEVLKDSPSFKAWLKPLDRITMINTWYVENETLDESVNRIKWLAGTFVKLTIERFNWEKKEIIEKEIKRESIKIPSVLSEVLDVEWKKIWYIEIFLIWEETENIFKREVNELKKQDIEWIILDLRWNGWWLMPIAVEIVSHFVKKWELVVYADYKWYQNEEFYSKWFGDFEWIETVVLIDWLTASAWEIIAMALQEQAWAKLIWVKTFGKGTIQTLEEFDNGDSLKYTIWKRYAPSKRNIDKTGVSPDIVVEFDLDKYLSGWVDNQLEEAKNLF